MSKEPKRWVKFEIYYPKKSKKTKEWKVLSTFGNAELGMIRWYAAWRCYSFYPFSFTIFEKTCLNDIATFCENQTYLHKQKAKKEKAKC